MAAMKKDEMPIYCYVSLLPSVLLTFMSGPSIFKILNSMSDIKSKPSDNNVFNLTNNLICKFCIFSLIQ